MAQRSVNRKGWGGSGCGWSVDAEQQPQWIAAGAFSPLSTNTTTIYTSQEITVGDNLVYNTIGYNFGTSDKWYAATKSPVNWTSGKIKFIAHYIIVDNISVPGNYIWTLGVEYTPDEFQLNNCSFQTVSCAADVAPGSAEPYYFIAPESAELTITGAAAAGGLLLRLERGADTESDPAYFVGLFLEYV